MPLCLRLADAKVVHFPETTKVFSKKVRKGRILHVAVEHQAIIHRRHADGLLDAPLQGAHIRKSSSFIHLFNYSKGGF